MPATTTTTTTTPYQTTHPSSASLAFDLPLDDDQYNTYAIDDAPKTSPLPCQFRKPRTTQRTFLSDDDASSDDVRAVPNNLLFESVISPRRGTATNEEENNHLTNLLAGVRFTQLSECDVCSSDDDEQRTHEHRRVLPPREPSSHNCQLSNHPHADLADHGGDDDDDDNDSWFGGVHLTRTPYSPLAPPENELSKERHPTTHAADSNSLPPTNSYTDSCSMCSDLAFQNRRLRRLLDEADFRLAVVQAERHSDSSSSSSSSWNSSLSRRTRSSRHSSFSSSSDKSRVRAELKALTVTTEYLWRKLNSAERELSELRSARIRGPPSPAWHADIDDQLATRIDPAALLYRARSQ